MSATSIMGFVLKEKIPKILREPFNSGDVLYFSGWIGMTIFKLKLVVRNVIKSFLGDSILPPIIDIHPVPKSWAVYCTAQQHTGFPQKSSTQ